MFEKKIFKKMNLGVHLKGSKRVLMGQKSYFLLIRTYFLEYFRPEWSPAFRRCARYETVYFAGGAELMFAVGCYIYFFNLLGEW